MNAGTRLVTLLFTSMVVLSVVLPATSEWIALALMIGAGIPHGSFDLRVAQATSRSTVMPRTRIAAIYLTGVLSMSALCVFVPAAGLSLFLCISALHFSEGELQSSPSTNITTGILFGIGAIILPIGLHCGTAMEYLEYFVRPSIFELVTPIIAILSLFVVTAIALCLIRDCKQQPGLTPATIERCICLISWVLLPPLAGFSVWFVGRHSHQHLELCRKFLQPAAGRMPLDFAIISLLAISGLLPFSFAFDFSEINQLFAASICLIAGLTLPHMILSHLAFFKINRAASDGGNGAGA